MSNERQVVNYVETVGDPTVRNMLLRIVVRMEHNPSSHADLMQEALIHFWLAGERNPGNSLSWYLQSCRFHLQHVAARGKSVDSPKRAKTQYATCWETSGPTDTFEATAPDADILSEVSAREIISLLSSRLGPRQREVLNGLADGLHTCEIAEILNVSHPAVVKHRLKIAAAAVELGIVPTTTARDHHAYAESGSHR